MCASVISRLFVVGDLARSVEKGFCGMDALNDKQLDVDLSSSNPLKISQGRKYTLYHCMSLDYVTNRPW
jgi:hypothetical protein